MELKNVVKEFTMKKLITITIIPFALGIVLSRTLPSGETVSPAVEAESYVRNYTVGWGSRSFDEALWQTVAGIATIEELLPSHVQRFQVEIRSPNDVQPPVSLGFQRAALSRLKVGRIAPDVFIRDHVEFD